MKILTLYYSKSGNTKIIAEAIHSTASQKHKASIETIKEIKGNELNGYDLIFIGAPCHHATLAKVMLSYLETIPSKPTFKIAGFYTHSTVHADGTKRNDYLFNEWAGRTKIAFENTAKEKEIELLGQFHCQGSATFFIEKFIRLQIIKDKNEWLPYRKEMRQHPNNKDIEDVKAFADMIIKKADISIQKR